MPHNGTPISPVLTDNGSVQELNPNGGGVLNQLPSLKAQGEISRLQLTTFNEYKDSTGNRYDATHPNAQSDGDDHGRGEQNPNGGVGTLIDSQTKTTLLYSSGNKFSPVAGYYSFTFGEQYW
jgi:hypothetical protein